MQWWKSGADGRSDEPGVFSAGRRLSADTRANGQGAGTIIENGQYAGQILRS